MLFGDGIGQSLGAGAERPQAMKLIFGETAFKLFGFQRKAGFDTDCPGGALFCLEAADRHHAGGAFRGKIAFGCGVCWCCPAGKDECREQGGKQYSDHAGFSRFDEVLIAPSIANRLEILA